MKPIKLKKNIYFKLFLYFYIFIFLSLTANGALAKDKEDFFVQPEVIETRPLNNAQNVALDSEIFVKFNIQMAKWSVEENLIISPVAQGKIGWYCGWELTFIPAQSLQCHTTYNVKINGQAVGKTGYPLGNDYIFSFTTLACDNEPDLPPLPPGVVPTTTVLSLQKTGTPVAQIGSQIEYQISYKAEGTQINALVLEDFLPTLVDFIHADGNYSYSSSTKRVVWNLGDFSTTTQGIFNLTGKIKEVATTTELIVNEARLSTNSQKLAAYATTTLEVAPALKPEIKLEKELLNVTSSFNFGDELEFEIKITNSGGTVLDKIPLADVFDQSYLNFISATPTLDSLATSTTSSTLAWHDLTQHFGSLSPGENLVVKVFFKVATSTPSVSQNLALSENIQDEFGNFLPFVKDQLEFKINKSSQEDKGSGQDSGQGGPDVFEGLRGGGTLGGPNPQIEPNLILWLDYAAEKLVGGLCLEKINLKNSGSIYLTNGFLTLNLPEDKLKFISSPQNYEEYDDFNQIVVWQIPNLSPDATTSIDFEIKALNEGETISFFKADFNEIDVSTTTYEIIKAVTRAPIQSDDKKSEYMESQESKELKPPVQEDRGLELIAGEEIYLQKEEQNKLKAEEAPLIILPQVYSQTAEKCADCSKWLWLVIILIHLICLALFYIYLLPEKIISADNENQNLPNNPNNIKILKGSFKWWWSVFLGLVLIFLILFFVCRFNLLYSGIILAVYYAALFSYYILLRHQTGKIKKIWPAILITLFPVLTYILCSPWSVWAWILALLFYGLTMFCYYLSLIKLKDLKWWGIAVFCLTVLVVILERVMEGCGCV